MSSYFSLNQIHHPYYEYTRWLDRDGPQSLPSHTPVYTILYTILLTSVGNAETGENEIARRHEAHEERKGREKSAVAELSENKHHTLFEETATIKKATIFRG